MTYTLTQEEYDALRAGAAAARRAVMARFSELVRAECPHLTGPAAISDHYANRDYISRPALYRILDTLDKEFK